MPNGHAQTLPSADVLLARSRITAAADLVRLAAFDAYSLGQVSPDNIEEHLNEILQVFNTAAQSLRAMRGDFQPPACPWPTRPVGDMCM